MEQWLLDTVCNMSKDCCYQYKVDGDKIHIIDNNNNMVILENTTSNPKHINVNYTSRIMAENVVDFIDDIKKTEIVIDEANMISDDIFKEASLILWAKMIFRLDRIVQLLEEKC